MLDSLSLHEPTSKYFECKNVQTPVPPNSKHLLEELTYKTEIEIGSGGSTGEEKRGVEE